MKPTFIRQLPFLGADTEGDVRLDSESDRSQNYAVSSSPYCQPGDGDELSDELPRKILPLPDCVKYRF